MSEDSVTVASTSRRQLAGVGRRGIGILIDAAILYILTLIVAHLTGYDVGYSPVGFAFPVVGWVVWGISIYLYFVILEWAFGRTIGKACNGTRVRTTTGERLGLVASLIRNIMRLVDAIPYVPFPYLVGAISIWNTEHEQRLGDMLARSVVETSLVREPAETEPPVRAATGT